MRKHKSVILKLLSAACALLLAIQVMSPAAYALNGVAEGGDAASGPLYDVYQIFQCDVRPAEEADLPYLDEGVQIGDKLASNFRFGKNIDIAALAGDVDLTDPDFLAMCAEMGIVPEVGGTIPDAIVESNISSLRNDSYGDQDYTIWLQWLLDANSEPYASGLTLSELNAYAAEPGYYLITNTPGSVTGNNGYTRGITTVTDSETGFDVIPKSFSLEIDKSVARIPFMGAGWLNFGSDAEPFADGGALPGADIPEELLGLADNLLAIITGLDIAAKFLDEGYDFAFDKKVLLNASDAALYKLTVQVPEDVAASFPGVFYMQIQDMLPDGFIGFPVLVDVLDCWGEYVVHDDFGKLILPFDSSVSSLLLPEPNKPIYGDGPSLVWLSNVLSATDFDLLRSEFKINVLLNKYAYDPHAFTKQIPDSQPAVVNVYIYAMPVLDGHDTEQMPVVLDANVNNSRLLYQNNPNEQVVFAGDATDGLLVWYDLSERELVHRSGKVSGLEGESIKDVYCHRCSDTGIDSDDSQAVSIPDAPDMTISYKQLSLACTADSDRTQADAHLSGLTFYYGSHTGQPISNAEFSLRRLPLDYSLLDGAVTAEEFYGALDAVSGMTFAALRQPVFSASEIGLYRKLTSGAYTPLTNLSADRYADELLYQAHASHMPSLGYIAPMLPQDGGTDLDETRMAELLDKNAVIITTDENGMVSFVGLPMGDYCLEPLAPVQGYNMAEPVCFRIGADASGEGRQISFVRPDYTAPHNMFGDGISLFGAPGQENAPELVMSPDGWFYLNLIASSGVVLPTTGGAGTAAIIATGAGLLGIAIAFVLIRRRRQNAPVNN